MAEIKKMRDMDVREKAVAIATEALNNGTFMEKAEPAGNKTYAYPCEIAIEPNAEPTEVWVTVELVCKSWKPYKTKYGEKPAYNPYEVQAEYEAEQEIKAREKADREAKKAKKIAKSKA